jgi:hypothetical protein
LAVRSAAAAKADPSLPSLRIAKLDGTLNPETMKRHDVQFYPTIKLYANGEVLELIGLSGCVCALTGEINIDFPVTCGLPL